MCVCVLRATYGHEDTYALACNYAYKFYCRGCGAKYRDWCMIDQEVPRNDTTSLEYPIWRMTRLNHTNRLHDIPTMKALIAKVTHV